jgi:hypothetical protein
LQTIFSQQLAIIGLGKESNAQGILRHCYSKLSPHSINQGFSSFHAVEHYIAVELGCFNVFVGDRNDPPAGATISKSSRKPLPRRCGIE